MHLRFPASNGINRLTARTSGDCLVVWFVIPSSQEHQGNVAEVCTRLTCAVAKCRHRTGALASPDRTGVGYLAVQSPGASSLSDCESR